MEWHETVFELPRFGAQVLVYDAKFKTYKLFFLQKKDFKRYSEIKWSDGKRVFNLDSFSHWAYIEPPKIGV